MNLNPGSLTPNISTQKYKKKKVGQSASVSCEKKGTNQITKTGNVIHVPINNLMEAFCQTHYQTLINNLTFFLLWKEGFVLRSSLGELLILIGKVEEGS